MPERGPVTEQQQVWWHRYNEARKAGLPHEEAAVFAQSGEDVGILRRCVENGWTPKQIAQIVI